MYHEIVAVKLNETSLLLIFYRAELLLWPPRRGEPRDPTPLFMGSTFDTAAVVVLRIQRWIMSRGFKDSSPNATHTA